MTMFPAVRASNLNGRSFDLPGDFEGERNLVILAFQREQQALVDSWSPAIANLLARYADLCFYELPIIKSWQPALPCLARRRDARGHSRPPGTRPHDHPVPGQSGLPAGA